jgi:hypothetical protein
MGPLLIMFGERPFVDCIEKVDGNFVVDFGSWLVEMIESWSLFC